MPDVIDEMIQVPDPASIATMRWFEKMTGRKVGPSTGTNLWGALQVAREMRSQNISGSIVTLLCDSGDRYLQTYHNPEWVKEHLGDPRGYMEELETMVGSC